MKELHVDCLLYLKTEENEDKEQALDRLLAILNDNDIEINCFHSTIEEVD